MEAYLAIVTVRALALAAFAWIAMEVCRVKSPAARHAVWSAVTAGMLALAVVMAAAPSLPVRVLRAPAPISVVASPVAMAAPVAAVREVRTFPWAVAIYAAGLAWFALRLGYGYFRTRRLVRSARPIARFEGVMESAEIAVPVTVGWLRARILLPPDWTTWSAERLEHVLAHERAHVERGDWAVAAMAGVNRCVFWFHPLAWWLERELAALAEHTCDDAALAQTGSSSGYAETLLAMAAALRDSHARATWEATAMAKTSEVTMRIERILDETRPVFRAMTMSRWLALALCGVPLIYLTAVVRPARVRAQSPAIAAPAPVATPAPVSAPRPVQELAAEQAEAASSLHLLTRQKQMLELQMERNAENLAKLEPSVPEPEKLDRMRMRMATLQSEIEAMMEQLTPNHPQVKRAQASLAAMQRTFEEQARRAAGDLQGSEQTVAELQAANGHLESEMQRLNAQIEENNRQIEKLNHTIKTAPAVFHVTAPKIIYRREPEYTEEARKGRIEGNVELSVTISADGAVQDAHVTRSLDAGLDRSAIECVKQWRFTPMVLNGEKVAATQNVTVSFRLLR